MKTEIVKRYKSKDIAAIIRKEIADRRLNAHTAVPSVRSLSERFGISTVTADKAINQLVEEDLIYRISGSGSYVKNDPRRIYKIGIGCTVSMAARHFNTNLPEISPMWEPCLEVFHKHGYEPQIIPYRTLRDPELSLRNIQELDGLLLSTAFVDSYTARELQHFKGKIVVFEGNFLQEQIPCSQVMPDLQMGVKQIFDLVNPHDYPGIIIIRAYHPNAQAITNALLAGLQKHDYPADRIQVKEIKVASGDNGQMSAYIASRAMAEKCRGKLVFSASDFKSFGFVNALREKKLEPGRDVDLISFDNLEGAFNILPFDTPYLTSVNMPVERIAREATELLINLLETRDDRTHIIKIPTHLEVRNTVKIQNSNPGEKNV